MVSLEQDFIDVSSYESADQDSKILDPSCNGCNLVYNVLEFIKIALIMLDN